MAQHSIILITGIASGTWIYDYLAAQLSNESTIMRATIAELASGVSAQDETIQRAIDGLRALLTSSSRPVTVIAHSLGGAIALALAEEPPPQLANLVIIDAGPRWVAPADRANAEREIDDQVRELLSVNSSGSVDERLRAWIGAMVSRERDRARLLADFRYYDPDFLREVLADGRKLQLRIDPRELNVRTLVTVACASHADLQPTLEEFRERYSGASDVEIVAINRASHFVMLDQPQETLVAIAAFLGKLSSK